MVVYQMQLVKLFFLDQNSVPLFFQVLKHPTNVTFKDRKLLANMAVACYSEQVHCFIKLFNYHNNII